MGAAAGVIDTVSLDALNGLFIEAQPGTMMLTSGGDMTAAQRDVKRAEMVREALK